MNICKIVLAYVVHVCKNERTMSKTIEITEDAARDMLPCLESKLENVEHLIETYCGQRDSLKTTIAELYAKLNGSELPLTNGGSLPRRLPKGHGDKSITDLLASLPVGQGLTMAEIKRKTGVNHSTIFRTFNLPERNKGRFIVEGGRWRLATKK